MVCSRAETIVFVPETMHSVAEKVYFGRETIVSDGEQTVSHVEKVCSERETTFFGREQTVSVTEKVYFGRETIVSGGE
jgi:hypothetical protein